MTVFSTGWAQFLLRYPICAFEPRPNGKKEFGGHSQLIKEEVGVHVTGRFFLSLKSLNGRYWDTGCHKGAAVVSLCTPANQKEANLITSKFSFTRSVCSRSCTLSTFYSDTPEQYLMVTTVTRCHHWAFCLGLLIISAL